MDAPFFIIPIGASQKEKENHNIFIISQLVGWVLTSD